MCGSAEVEEVLCLSKRTKFSCTLIFFFLFFCFRLFLFCTCSTIEHCTWAPYFTSCQSMKGSVRWRTEEVYIYDAVTLRGLTRGSGFAADSVAGILQTYLKRRTRGSGRETECACKSSSDKYTVKKEPLQFGPKNVRTSRLKHAFGNERRVKVPGPVVTRTTKDAPSLIFYSGHCSFGFERKKPPAALYSELKGKIHPNLLLIIRRCSSASVLRQSVEWGCHCVGVCVCCVCVCDTMFRLKLLSGA